MEPFFSGMAIGLAILIPLVILLFAFRVLMLLGAFVYGFGKAAHASWVQAHASRAPRRLGRLEALKSVVVSRTQSRVARWPLN